MTDINDPVTNFLRAAIWHGSLAPAEAILSAHTEVAAAGIHVAAVLGDDAAVRRFLAADPALATAKREPYGANALVYLCLSNYLRLDPARSGAFLQAATALLDAGADANSGFWSTGPFPVFESALYGAAGVAHHAGLTRLLLERGADPNDEEVPYHSPETHDNAALHVLVESGKLTAESLGMMLLRKTDYHDGDGLRYLLEHGVDPNRMTRWGKTAFHNAVLSDNTMDIFDALLDHGADPTLVADQPLRGRPGGTKRSGVAMAARRGRADVLASVERRGWPVELHGVDRLIAACARDGAAVAEPAHVAEVIAEGGTLLAEFAGVGNTAGVRRLLDLGVSVVARYGGDGYFDIAPNSTALHVAAWRARHDTVRLLIERGAVVDATDGAGRTPLQLAVKACVDSYWSDRRSPESVAALLAAGASSAGVQVPCGYADVDALLTP